MPGKQALGPASEAGQKLQASPRPSKHPAKENRPSPEKGTSSVPPTQGTSKGISKGRSHRRTASEVPSSGPSAGRQVMPPGVRQNASARLDRASMRGSMYDCMHAYGVQLTAVVCLAQYNDTTEAAHVRSCQQTPVAWSCHLLSMSATWSGLSSSRAKLLPCPKPAGTP